MSSNYAIKLSKWSKWDISKSLFVHIVAIFQINVMFGIGSEHSKKMY